MKPSNQALTLAPHDLIYWVFGVFVGYDLYILI